MQFATICQMYKSKCKDAFVESDKWLYRRGLVYILLIQNHRHTLSHLEQSGFINIK